LVDEVRRVLTRKPVVELQLERLIDACAEAGHDLRLRDITGSVAPWIVAARPVRGAFTRGCWEALVRDQIAAAELEAADPWVLGLDPAEVERRASELRDALSSRY